MYIVADTLDDILRGVFPALLENAEKVAATRGPTAELIGAMITLKQPRARLSRTETRGKPFSCLGELLWYLSRSNSLDFISPYIPEYNKDSDDGETIHGAYGPRLFSQRGCDQIRSVVDLLTSRSSSRRAVIQLFNAEDLSNHYKDIPCTTTLQFLIRNDRLHMITTMRSNDAYKGLPHDIFCFTMLQEIVARSLKCDVGEYYHFAGSLHLYEKDRAGAQQFMAEKYQQRIEMPSMPLGDPWRSIDTVLEAERQIKRGEFLDAASLDLEPYWADLVRLLQVFAATGQESRISDLKAAMHWKRYASYINNRVRMKPLRGYKPIQLQLKI